MKKTYEYFSDEHMYLDWVNNFLTVARFAEYYGMTEEQAHDLIKRMHKAYGLHSKASQCLLVGQHSLTHEIGLEWII